jgi:hypothetical protein
MPLPIDLQQSSVIFGQLIAGKEGKLGTGDMLDPREQPRGDTQIGV